MDKPEPEVTDALRHDLEASWHRFLDLYEPLRPELYRYCRHLTRSNGYRYWNPSREEA